MDLYEKNSQISRDFLDNIRSFNNLLAFASTSASLDPKMHTPGPYNCEKKLTIRKKAIRNRAIRKEAIREVIVYV